MRPFAFIFLILIPFFSSAQGEYNIWHFGKYEGVDFNSGSPVGISGPIVTDEGTACICDASGNLLFSTDGETVYKSNGTVMGTGLWGSVTSTQSAIIIPKPGSASIYYIFTSAGWGYADNGISYSVVDMNLGGGLGALTSINIQLIAPACEKLTAVRHGNGTDFWVIARKYPEGQYYAFPVTAAGVGSPVISVVGATIVNNYNKVGYLVASPDGHRIASAMFGNNPYSVELLDFSVSSGILSNAVGIADTFGYYGACFSPDGSKLYMSPLSNDSIRIVQYDMTAPDILSSGYILYAHPGLMQGGIQLGPDGKIYSVTNGDKYLDVINFPNLAGAACGFQDSAVQLTGNYYCKWGVPNNFQTLFYTGGCEVNLGSGASLCNSGGTVTLHSGTGFNNYLWSTGATTQNLTVATTGDYAVTVTTSQGCTAADTITVSQPATATYTVVSQSDSLPCSANTGGHIDIDVTLGTPPYHYQWSNGGTLQDINNIPLGNYVVTITDNAGCVTVSDTFNIALINSMQITGTVTDVFGCHGGVNGTIDLDVTGFGSPLTILWDHPVFFLGVYYASAGTYIVNISETLGCYASDTFVVNQPDSIVLSVASVSDTITCVNYHNGYINIDVSGGISPFSYHWNNGITNQNLNGLNAGNYIVTMTDSSGCVTVSDTFHIKFINTLDLNNLSPDFVPCNGDTNGEINLAVSGGLAPLHYHWNNGNTTQYLNNLVAGNYRVTVSDNGVCMKRDTFYIIEPNQLTLNISSAADTLFCNAAGGTPPYHYNWSMGGTAMFITNASNGNFAVTVTDNHGCFAVDSIFINSAETISSDLNLEIYPNPASGQLIIDNSRLSDGQGQLRINEIQITDVLGRVVQSFEFKVQSPVIIDVSDYAEGVYFIKLVSASGVTVVKKFVVVH